MFGKKKKADPSAGVRTRSEPMPEIGAQLAEPIVLPAPADPWTKAQTLEEKMLVVSALGAGGFISPADIAAVLDADHNRTATCRVCGTLGTVGVACSVDGTEVR